MARACLPYKITYFSNLIVLSWRCGTGLFTIQNYILLKPQMSAFLYNMGLFTIQNYILLKLFGKPPQSPHTLVCHKKLHTSQIIEKLKMIQIKFYNHIKLHTSQTIIDEISMCRSLTTI